MNTSTNQIIIYEDENGLSRAEVRLEGETLWLTQDQIAALFDRERSVVTKHINNIYAEGELEKATTCANFAQVQIEGSRTVTRQIEHYNLDLILSVGYRVNSIKGTRFRRWATSVLKDHLLKGYSIDRKRLETNNQELEAALTLVHRTAQNPQLSADAGRGLVEIVTRYTQTFLLLQRYDQGLLTEPKAEMGGILASVSEMRKALATLKEDLIRQGQATDLFAKERGDAFEALLGNLEQTVFGEPAYPSIEAKAAHLLYFVIKNHPFADGNKRSGAYLFVAFLNENGRLFDKNDNPVINDIGLAALALLIAESDPDQKEIMIRLVMNMLAIHRNPEKLK